MGNTILAALLALSVVSPANGVTSISTNDKLLYVQQVDGGCVAGLWDSKDQITLMKSAVTKCPVAVSLTAHARILILIGDAGLQTFDVSNGRLGTLVPLPEGITINLNTEALRAGYTPDGALAFRVVAGNGDGSSDERLYLSQNAGWTVAEQVHCPSPQNGCPFKQPFDSRALDDWSGTGAGKIWNDALAGDPYVAKRVPRNVDFAPPSESMRLNNSIVFRIDGHYTKLRFRAIGHGGVMTMGLELEAPDGRVLDITNVQFDATIRGRYLLFYPFFRGGTQLYDLGDGRVVLDRLTDAGWLH